MTYGHAIDRCPRQDCGGALAADDYETGIKTCLWCARRFVVAGGFTLAVVPPTFPALIGGARLTS